MSDQEYKVNTPQGVRVIRGPAGASDADIIAQAQKLFAEPIDFPKLQAQTQAHRQAESRVAMDPLSTDARATSQEGVMPTWLAGAPGATYAQRVAGTPAMGIATGAAKPVLGTAQLLAHLDPRGIASDDANNTLSTFQDMRDTGRGSSGFDPADFVGQVLSPMNVGMARAIGTGPSAVGNVARGAALGGAYGLATPVMGDDYWGQKGVQTAAGAAGGALPAAASVASDFLLGKGSRRVMQSAIKPSITEPQSKVDRAITTMLDNGINVTPGGMNKLRGMGNAANAEVAAALAPSTAQIDPNAVAARLADTNQRFASQVAPQSDLAAIDSVRNDFMNHPQVPGSTMPVQLAQALKQGTYQQLRDKYGELGSASTEAQKALARGLKEEIETAVPGVIDPNARAAEIWNALSVAKRRAMVAGNNNPLGLAAMVIGHPAAAAATTLDRSTWVRSLLARGMNNANKGVQSATKIPYANLAAAALAEKGAE